MAFSGKVDVSAGLVFCQQACQQGAVTYVALSKGVVRIVLQAGQSLRVARVGELFEVDDRFMGPTQPASLERNCRQWSRRRR